MKREYSSPYISDLTTDRVGVQCETCGLRKRYNRAALIAKIGDQNLPGLLGKLARAEGCTRVDNRFADRCRLIYDEDSRPQPRKDRR